MSEISLDGNSRGHDTTHNWALRLWRGACLRQQCLSDAGWREMREGRELMEQTRGSNTVRDVGYAEREHSG